MPRNRNNCCQSYHSLLELCFILSPLNLTFTSDLQPTNQEDMKVETETCAETYQAPSTGVQPRPGFGLVRRRFWGPFSTFKNHSLFDFLPETYKPFLSFQIPYQNHLQQQCHRRLLQRLHNRHNHSDLLPAYESSSSDIIFPGLYSNRTK